MFRKVTFKSVTTHVAAGLMGLILCSSASANFKELSTKLPAGTNSIVAVNVAKLLQTDYAKNEWIPTTADAWANKPMMIPPGSTRLLTAAEVRTNNMESIWELSLMELEAGKMPTVQAIAAAEGGNVDRLWDKDAVASPINAYFIPMSGTILASITPASRAGIAKWLRTPTTRPEGNVTSEYIQKVLAGLGDQTDIVMAMDLEGAWGVPNIRRWIDENDFKDIPDGQKEVVARTLSGMLGITLNIRVDKDVNASAVVDFDKDASILNTSAKAIFMQVLDTAGFRIDDAEQWTFIALDKQVKMQGKLSTASLRKLLSIVQSPVPAATVADASGTGSGPAATPAEASVRYYRTICASLDNFKPGKSAAESAGRARNLAKRIEQLPILQVDPQLVQWGSTVSTKLKQAGGGMAVGQTQMNARVAGIADPSYSDYSYSSDGGSYTYANNDKVAQDNANKQRRQAALEVKAQAQEQALSVLNEIAETRPVIRAAMVEKYKIEF